MGPVEGSKGPSPAERAHLASRDLLQCILALGEARILHDEHDDRHLLVNQRQGPMLQLPSQDAFRVHVGYLFNFLGKQEVGSCHLGQTRGWRGGGERNTWSGW